MKVSEAKDQLRAITGRSKEALTEISAKIAAQQAKITELEASVNDPEVTDAETLAIIGELKTVTDQLAEIVPDVPATPPTDTTPTEPPATV